MTYMLLFYFYPLTRHLAAQPPSPMPSRVSDCDPIINTGVVSRTLTKTVFLPIILRENMGFSLAASQCLIAPPYAFSAILMYLTSWVGDRFRVRGIIIVANSLIAIIGLPIMGFHADPAVRYFGVFIAVGGANANVPALMAYQVSRTSSIGIVSTRFGELTRLFA